MADLFVPLQAFCEYLNRRGLLPSTYKEGLGPPVRYVTNAEKRTAQCRGKSTEYLQSVLPVDDSVNDLLRRYGVPPRDWILGFATKVLIVEAQSCCKNSFYIITEKDLLLWYLTWYCMPRDNGELQIVDCSRGDQSRFGVFVWKLAYDYLHDLATLSKKSSTQAYAWDDKGPTKKNNVVEEKKKEKENKNMAIDNGISGKLTLVKNEAKRDAVEAMYRTSAKVAVDGARGLIVTGLKSRGKSNARARQVAAFLETDHGRAVLAVLLGNMPLLMPQLTSDPRFTKLAKEMRISGMQHATDLVAGELAGPLTAIFTSAVAAIPAGGTDDGEG